MDGQLDIAKLQAELAARDAELAARDARIAELEQQVAADSRFKGPFPAEALPCRGAAEGPPLGGSLSPRW